MLLIPDRDSNVQFADHQPSPLTAEYMLSTFVHTYRLAASC